MRQKLKTETNGKGSSETATPYRNGLKLGRRRRRRRGGKSLKAV